MKLPHLVSTLVLTLGALAHAHAAPLVLGDQIAVDNKAGTVFTPSTASDGLFTNVTFQLDHRINGSASAGLFVLDHQHVPAAARTSWTQFLSFCLEPDVALSSFDNPYTVNSIASAGYSAVGSAISELWGRYFGLVTNDTTAAAFQVALWELAYGTTDKDLGKGDFKLTSNGDVKTTAQRWLNGLDGTGAKAEGLVVLVDNPNATERQDLITQGPVQAVPEPAMLALLGIGLAGVGMARRRKAALSA